MQVKFDWLTHIKGAQLALRASVAVAVAVAIAQLFNLDSPIYVLLSAVIVTDLKPSESRRLGLLRLASTVVGAVCGAVLSPLLPPRWWSIGLSILIAMLICQLLRAREGAKVAGFICGIIVLDNSAAPWRDSALRFVETALGVIIAWLISYVPKLIRLDEPDDEAERSR
jgi:uncharacterized membrane protein YgaE (UPF0421/DUF939 family)